MSSSGHCLGHKTDFRQENENWMKNEERIWVETRAYDEVFYTKACRRGNSMMLRAAWPFCRVERWHNLLAAGKK